MAVEFRIVSVRVRTHRGWQEPYDLDSAIVVVWGPVDTGKTSLLDSIAFAFGRDVEFRGVVARELREVQVRVQVGSSEYELNRSCRTKSTVKVSDAAGTAVGKWVFALEWGGAVA
jgi:hypothetical protein